MLSFLHAWWPLLLVLQVPYLLRLTASTLFHRVRHQLDHATPDTLPLTAGQWLERQIAAFALRVRAIATGDDPKRSRNAFYIEDQLIQLTQQAYFKRDPVYWATAAHELGHARFRIRSARIAAALGAAATVKNALVSIGLALGLGNMLYGLAGVTNLAFVLLAVALGLHALEVVEEMIASALAFSMLRNELHLTPRHLRNARISLGFALSTYVTAFIGHAILLGAWSLVEANTTRRPVELHTLTAFGGGVAIVASVVVLIDVVGRLFRLVERRPRWIRGPFLVTTIAGLFALPGLLWLVWDLRAGSVHAWMVMLAAIPCIRLITALVEGVMQIPMLLIEGRLHRLARWLEGPGVEQSRVYRDDLSAGSKLVRSGNAELDKIIERHRAKSWLTWSQRLLPLLAIPIVVALWVL